MPKLFTDPNAVHDCAYQGKEFQFAEFTTGHGLARYDSQSPLYGPLYFPKIGIKSTGEAS